MTPIDGSEGAPVEHRQHYGVTFGVLAPGRACLFANAAAIITDAFPAHQRGMALATEGNPRPGGTACGLTCRA
jgi:hypothetical protein